MNRNNLKEFSKWFSQLNAATSLVILVYLKSRFIINPGNFVSSLILVLLIAAFFTLVFGIMSLPRWQGFLTLGIFTVVTYFILFTPLYELS